MPTEAGKMKDVGGKKPSEDTGWFPVLHGTRQGRIHHCPEFRRIVIDFMGVYLVLREDELLRLQKYFTRLAGCSWSRSRIERGERIRLQGSLGEPTLMLGLAEVEELTELMATGASRLESAAREKEKQCPI